VVDTIEVAPEFNRSIPGALKNASDCRPRDLGVKTPCPNCVPRSCTRPNEGDRDTAGMDRVHADGVDLWLEGRGLGEPVLFVHCIVGW
jgi:hypothetical protein